VEASHWLTTLPAPQFSSQQEKGDFYYARSLQLQGMQSQHHINTFHQTLVTSPAPTCTTTSLTITKSEQSQNNPLDILAVAASKELQQ